LNGLWEERKKKKHTHTHTHTPSIRTGNAPDIILVINMIVPIHYKR